MPKKQQSRKMFFSILLMESCYYTLNLLKSGVLIKPVVSSILFSISVALVLRANQVARYVILVILFSYSDIFVYGAAFVVAKVQQQ